MDVTTAWEIAQKIADNLPPFLADDELTVERFYLKNKDKISIKEARDVLDKLVEAGKLEKQQRRQKGKGAGHVLAYVIKDAPAAVSR